MQWTHGHRICLYTYEMSITMFNLNVLWIKCPIDKTIDSGLGIKCPVYKMVSLFSYVMYHTRICLYICDTKLLPVLCLYYCLTMSCFLVLIVIFMNYSGLSFFCCIYYRNSPTFCKTNSSGGTLDTRRRKKLFSPGSGLWLGGSIY